MGTSHGDFTKYPRTPHLCGSKGTDDDKHLNESESMRFVSDESLIIQEKLDGTNVGIHFSDAGELVLQARDLMLAAGNPTYTDAERLDIGNALRGTVFEDHADAYAGECGME